MRGTMLAATVAACLVPGAALSDDAGRGAPPDGDDTQRYTMSKTAEGFLRLDRETGTVSLCKGGAGRWSCVPVPDAQVALDDDIHALEQENERLKARVAELQARLRDMASSAETDLPGERHGATPSAPEDGRELTDSEKRQIDKFVDFSEHAMRRFFGFMKTMREEYEKGL